MEWLIVSIILIILAIDRFVLSDARKYGWFAVTHPWVKRAVKSAEECMPHDKLPQTIVLELCQILEFMWFNGRLSRREFKRVYQEERKILYLIAILSFDNMVGYEVKHGRQAFDAYIVYHHAFNKIKKVLTDRNDPFVATMEEAEEILANTKTATQDIKRMDWH